MTMINKPKSSALSELTAMSCIPRQYS